MRVRSVALVIFFAFAGFCLSAQELSPQQRVKINALMECLKPLGTDPVVVKAVLAFNESEGRGGARMSEKAWEELGLRDPAVLAVSRNNLALYLQARCLQVVTELYVSGADGGKVAFLAKTAKWSHSGLAKHERPMRGETWIGEPVRVAATDTRQVQVSFPVLDGSKAIGSIVLSLDLGKL